jgi:molecular chaperone DnaK (HSP70)
LQTVSLSSVPTAQDDEQLLQQVAATRPSSASTYESNLEQINASIADARKTLEQNPDDEDARQSLVRAYQQKAMLYELAGSWQ